MKVWLIIGVLLGTVAALGGLLVAASGIIPIKASSGHFAITEWFLQFSKERSVAMHTIGLKLPPLDSPALVIRGAGAYEVGCRPCHGSPDLPHPRIPRAMLPPPPYLPERIPDWEPEELFYIVKHGIKFTGMPAWVSQQRDDEVQAVVAFLLEFPKLDAAGYRRLVHGDRDRELAKRGSKAPLAELAGNEPPPTAASENCARCHGDDGLGRGDGAFPRLAGQRSEYLLNALKAYATDKRQSGIMQPVAAAFGDAELRALANHYARLKPAAPPAAPAGPSDRIERGRKIAREGIPDQNVPSCAECHGPQSTKRSPAYPILAGQHTDYLVLQLELLKERKRGGSSYVHIMHKIVPRLGREQIRDVSAYYASLPVE
jgi:cytochrome c553